MADMPKWRRDADERDRRVEQRIEEILAHGVPHSDRKPVFVPAEDIDSNAELRCPVCGGPTLYGTTRRVHVCENCDWYYFVPQPKK